MEHMRLSPLIKEEEIKTRVAKMGEAITDKYKGKDLVLVGVLKGSFMFFADLIRSIDTDLTTDYIGVTSYEGASSSGDLVALLLGMP